MGALHDAQLAKPAVKPLAAIAGAAFVALVVASMIRPYGWFIDELYYLACARRPAFGYVDHPPLSIAILAVVRALAGESLLAVRVVAAGALAGTVFLTGALARELGGDRLAQSLAATAIASGAGFLAIGSFFSMNVFEILAWTTIALLSARALRLRAPRQLAALGIAVGLALLNKHTAATFVGVLLVAMLATSGRRVLATRWSLIAAAIALLIFSPNLIWQWQNGFPSLEFYRAAQASKNVPTSPPAAIFAQVFMVGPVAFSMAVVGAASTLRAKDWRRVFGVAFVLLFVVMVASGSSRPDRVAGAYPMMFAAGAVVIERMAASRRWLAPAVSASFLVTGIAFGLVALPLLPPPAAAAYAKGLGIVPKIEKKSGDSLPQWLADRLGWEAFVARVAQVVASLPAEERSQAVLFAPDYGHAGALELFGPEHGLGTVMSDHNSYWLWSRHVADAPVLVAVDVSEDRLRALYDDVQVVSSYHCTEGCMPSRNDLPIVVARRPRRPIGDAWAGMKHFE